MKKLISLTEIEKITAGNTETLKELLSVFITESTLQIQKLQTHLTEGDLRELKNSAHKIKSSFMLIGLEKYRSLAEKIERSEEKNSKNLGAEVMELISIYTQAVEELKIKLKELS